MTDPADITLRPMTVEEYDAFYARSTGEYATEIAENFGVAIEAATERATTQMASLLPEGHATEHQGFLAIVGADDVALGHVWIGLSDKLGVREAFGYDFWIRPELRDAGIGRRAMELARVWAREHGAARLALNVFGDNARARHLYESFGFRVGSTNMYLPLD